MLVTELRRNVYEVSLSDVEMRHLRVILASDVHPNVYSVGTLIQYMLTWIEQHWFETMKEPDTDGNTSPPRLAGN